MARGWESKSVEEQIESAQTRRSGRNHKERRPGASNDEPTAAQIEVARTRENLTLSRTRILRELETSRNPRYVQLLNRELTVLEERLQKLN